MNAQSKITAAEPVTGAINCALAYNRARTTYLALEDMKGDNASTLEAARRSLWEGVTNLAAVAISQPPASIADVMLQLGIMSAWVGVVIDQAEGGSVRNLALAVDSGVQNAFRFLCDTVRDAPIEGEPLDLLNSLLADAINCGAETALEGTGPC